MPPEIDPLGFIQGGTCDKMHRERYQRHQGMRNAVTYYISKGIIVCKHGWYRLTDKQSNLTWREAEVLAGLSVGEKIGWYRFEQDLIPAIRKYGKAFRLSTLELWIGQLAGYELGVSADTPVGPFNFGLAPPHQPRIYEKRLKRGDFQ